MSIRAEARYALVFGTVAVGVPLVLATITVGIARGVVLARRLRGTNWDARAAAAVREPSPVVRAAVGPTTPAPVR